MSEAPPAEAGAASRRGRLAEVAWAFLRLGLLAFGGPAAHVALMEDEFVKRRRWLTREHFVDLLGAVNLIPGPNSTEMAIHIGHVRAGWLGLVTAGACFILPAALLTWGLAVLYAANQHLPAVDRALYGFRPVILVVVLQALAKLAPRALRTPWLLDVAVHVAALNLVGANELALLAGAGLVCLVRAGRARAEGAPALVMPLPLAAAGAGGATLPTALIFLKFLKIGSVLFGSGYVLLAFLRAELVEPNGPLSDAQLVDAVAIGQVTPGPVFSTATFIGYLLGGNAGAVAATVGIFLPAFVFVALSGPLIPRLRRSPSASAFLDGVNAASLALMAVVTLYLGRAALVDVPTVALAVVAGLLLWRWRLNTLWLMGLGLLTGLLAWFWR